MFRPACGGTARLSYEECSTKPNTKERSDEVFGEAEHPLLNNYPGKNPCRMFIVYILKSQKDVLKNYVGFTKDLDKRLMAHNAGRSLFSKRYAPWNIECFITFKNEDRARAFERYLKKGSGHAFLKKHFIGS
jgi:predicted GIY-YIG superfamily endonuclease